MAKIVEPPKPKRVSCNACRATIEYLPEEVKTRVTEGATERDVLKYVKCPRPGCPGEGVTESY